MLVLTADTLGVAWCFMQYFVLISAVVAVYS